MAAITIKAEIALIVRTRRRLETGGDASISFPSELNFRKTIAVRAV
jgi:hypothetical protein